MSVAVRARPTVQHRKARDKGKLHIELQYGPAGTA